MASDKNKRKACDPTEQRERLLKKRTLILGENDSSDDEVEVVVKEESTHEKVERLFPGWWEQDQHPAECWCEFCLLMFSQSQAQPQAPHVEDGHVADRTASSVSEGPEAC